MTAVAMRGQCQKGRPGDHRCTPEVIWRAALKAIERDAFCLDPATNEHSTVPAFRKCMGGELGDGLAWPWVGNVWLNPPFSKIMPWVEKAEQREFRSLTFLGPHDLSTKWAQRMTRACDAWAAWPRREHFPVPGQPKGSPPAGVALWYLGPNATRWVRVMREHGCLAYWGHP